MKDWNSVVGLRVKKKGKKKKEEGKVLLDLEIIGWFQSDYT